MLLTPEEVSLVRIAFVVNDPSAREHLVATVKNDPLLRLIRKIWREVDERQRSESERFKPFTFVVPRVNELLSQRPD